jgi:hypothetical protein
MCLWFSALALLTALMLFSGGDARANQVRVVVSLLFLAFTTAAITGQFRSQRRMICDFRYDGRILQFRTLGGKQIEMRPVPDIADVREWRGRGSVLGYQLRFRDERRVYLEYSVSNSAALADRLRAHTTGF